MSNQLFTSLSQVKAVEPRLLQILNMNGVNTIQDFLMVSNHQLTKKCKGKYTLKEIERIQSIFQLMQLRHVGEYLATLLTDHHIISFDSVASSSFTSLKSIFSDPAVTINVSDDQIADIKSEATLFENTGVLNGRLLSSDKKKIKNVTVACNNAIGQTDIHGRFRLIGIQAASSYRLHLVSDLLGYRTFDKVPVKRDSDNADIIDFDITKATSIYALKADEYLGETVPPMTRLVSLKSVIQNTPLRKNDILKFTNRLTSEIVLVSIFKSYEAGALYYRRWKLPLATIPDSIPIGTFFRTDKDGNMSIQKYRSTRVKMFIEGRKLKKELMSMPVPSTQTEYDVAANFIFKKVSGKYRRF